jgi:phospholipid-transporting ATPase
MLEGSMATLLILSLTSECFPASIRAEGSDDEYAHPNQSTGYLPSQSNPNIRGFGRSEPSLMESSRPLAQSGAVPAGFQGPDDKYHPSKGYAHDPFEDDEGPSAYAFSAPAAGPYAPRRSRWARFKEDHLTDVDWTFGVNALLGRKSKFEGVPREVALNDPEANRVKGYESNTVATGKYGPITFIPKFLFAEFSRSANLFFLFTGE